MKNIPFSLQILKGIIRIPYPDLFSDSIRFINKN